MRFALLTPAHFLTCNCPLGLRVLRWKGRILHCPKPRYLIPGAILTDLTHVELLVLSSASPHFSLDVSITRTSANEPGYPKLSLPIASQGLWLASCSSLSTPGPQILRLPAHLLSVIRYVLSMGHLRVRHWHSKAF